MNNTILKAKLFATEVHNEQTRKFSDELYIKHPERVAATVCELGGTDAMISAAWLHDVIEDCGVSYATIAAEFGPEIAEMVWGLTDQAPREWNRITRKSWEAGRLSMCSKEVQIIKIADLIDNTQDIVKSDPGFAKVYLKEKIVLLASLRKVPTILLNAAQVQVAEALQELENGI